MEVRQPVKMLRSARLLDLLIQERALLLYVCVQHGVPVPAIDALDVSTIPAEVLAAVHWAERNVYGCAE